MIQIFDGNNYYRKLLETSRTGLAPREVMEETFAAPHPQVWVWDGFKGTAKRREVYPDYKMNRTPQGPGLYEALKFMQKVLAHTPAIQLKVPGYEADDVVATLAKRYAKLGSDVEIHSNDYDFVQLTAEYPRIFCGARLKDDVKAKDIRLYKTTVGDPSDNIKGIKGFGQTSWPLVDKTALAKMILEDGPVPEMRPAAKKWADENRAQLKIYWEIVGFYDVPFPLIDQHMTVGDRNKVAADALLREFML